MQDIGRPGSSRFPGKFRLEIEFVFTFDKLAQIDNRLTGITFDFSELFVIERDTDNVVGFANICPDIQFCSEKMVILSGRIFADDRPGRFILAVRETPL